jgi:photosystem II stability/assembly factor-like uncharacterized protein
MHPDDVERAVDALLARVPNAPADITSIRALAQRRITQRRLVAVAVLVGFVVAGGAISALARSRHTAHAATRAVTPTTAFAPSADHRTADVLDLAVASPLEAWKCTDPLQYTDDGGRTWRTIPAPPTDSVTARNPNSLCAAVAGGNVWALRFPGGPRPGVIVRVRDAAPSETFPFPQVPPETEVLTVTFFDADHGWAVTTFNGPTGTLTPVENVFRTRDGGRTWTLAGQDVPVSSGVQFTSATRGWALASAFDLVTTTDSGATWQPVTLPAAPEGVFLTKVVARGSFVIVWCGAVTGASTPTFFDVSTDGGRTWSRRLGPPRLDTTGVSPLGFSAADATHWRLLAGALWITDDGGRTWASRARPAIDSVHSLAFPTPDVGWISGNSSASQVPVVLRTTDAGRTWTDLSNGLPTLAPAVAIPDVPGGIIGCPTRSLIPVPPGNPPPGVVPAAIAEVTAQSQWGDPVVTSAYRVGDGSAGAFGNAFIDNVNSCGLAIADASWVVELHYPAAAQLWAVVLAHYADGWQVYGSYG